MIRKLLLKYYLLLTVLLLLTVTGLSLYPSSSVPQMPGTDKLHHMLAYAALAFPVSFAKPKNYVWILLGLLAWSGAIELIQPLVNRLDEWADFFANAAGIAVGFIAGTLLDRILPK
ncbi:MAG TPA: hypothetical protein PKC24_11250 [Cyclobacteriaceae bacterium]|nr:hypothetical protein [Cyclobacteriaceae bacterium]